jgi:hypothetical protein
MDELSDAALPVQTDSNGSERACPTPHPEPRVAPGMRTLPESGLDSFFLYPPNLEGCHFPYHVGLRVEVGEEKGKRRRKRRKIKRKRRKIKRKRRRRKRRKIKRKRRRRTSHRRRGCGWRFCR